MGDATKPRRQSYVNMRRQCLLVMALILLLVGLFVSALYQSCDISAKYLKIAINEDSATQQIVKTSMAFKPIIDKFSDEQASASYAYCFVIGGVNLDAPLKHRGYIHNILVAARLFYEFHSKADIVAFFQLSPNRKYTNRTKLPEADARALQALGVKVRYLEPSETESFYETNMNKFRILTLTQYKRVLYLDGDVIPLANLDFLFELSLQGVLKPNLVIATGNEPANGGFFMLAPEQGDYKYIQEIIQARESKPFSVTEGFGHVITPPDEWVHRRGRGRLWDFYAGLSDQGLLYHWVKYEKKHVNLVFRDAVENWSSDDSNGTVVMEERLSRPFEGLAQPPLVVDTDSCRQYICEMKHFSGRQKPWMSPPLLVNASSRLDSAQHLWWYTLMQINRELNMGLDFDNWQKSQWPWLGAFTTEKGIELAIANRQRVVGVATGKERRARSRIVKETLENRQ